MVIRNGELRRMRKQMVDLSNREEQSATENETLLARAVVVLIDVVEELRRDVEGLKCNV